MPGHRGEGAELVSRQIPVSGLVLRRRHGDGKRAFETERGDDHLAPDARQFLLRKGTLVTGHQAIEDFGFPGRPDFDPVAPFGDADPFNHAGALHDQVMDGIVYDINFPAQGLEFVLIGCHGVRPPNS